MYGAPSSAAVLATNRIRPRGAALSSGSAARHRRKGAVALSAKWRSHWVTEAQLRLAYLAQAVACSAVERRESRGAHQRLDEFDSRDDERFLRHTLAHYQVGNLPSIDYADVNVTRLPPAERVYGSSSKKSA